MPPGGGYIIIANREYISHLRITAARILAQFNYGFWVAPLWDKAVTVANNYEKRLP